MGFALDLKNDYSVKKVSENESISISIWGSFPEIWKFVSLNGIIRAPLSTSWHRNFKGIER